MSEIIIYDAVQALEQAKHRATIVRDMRSSGLLVENKDFGVIPGAGKKPTLLKPGAERLCSAFGLAPSFEIVTKIETWNPEAPLFHYEYKCVLRHIESGKILADANGSCNSMESKYRWRWVYKSDAEALVSDISVLQKNKYNKYRVPNDDIFSQVNTISKMAQKRALVAAILIATNASEHFTQDIEDLPEFGSIVDAEYEEISEPERPPLPRNRQNPNPAPEPAIPEGTKKQVTIVRRKTVAADGNKPRYLFVTSELDGNLVVKAYSQQPFVDKFYCEKGDWETIDKVEDLKFTANIVMGKYGWWEFDFDTLPTYDPFLDDIDNAEVAQPTLISDDEGDLGASYYDEIPT